MWLDIKTPYVYNAETYAGKPLDGEHNIKQRRNVVLCLVKEAENTAQNMILDIFSQIIS